MVYIATYVFFDIETTGLPYQERNRTKIIEMSMIAVSRRDLRRYKVKGSVSPISKLTFLLNPHKVIYSSAIHGITNDDVKYAPSFEEKVGTIHSFLEDLKKPACLVAHNGFTFDYKVLLAECSDANFRLPSDLLCADTLPGFRKLLIYRPIIVDAAILTDDEDEWPPLGMTAEDFRNIDEVCSMCSTLSDLSCEARKIKKLTKKQNALITYSLKRESYKLVDVYKRLTRREPEHSHRAEADCLVLLRCVALCQCPEHPERDMLYWIDEHCKHIDEISPLVRH